MKKIGFITGIKKEALILKQAANYPKSKIISAGLKPGSAYSSAKQLAKEGCSTLISFGFAGALDPRLAAGDLVLPTSVMDPVGNIFNTDEILHTKISNHFSKKFTLAGGKVFGSKKIIWTAKEKKMIFVRHRATTVDMESLGVAQAAQESNCAFLIIRAISDTASQDLPSESLRSIKLDHQIRLANIFWKLSTNLNEFPSMLQLAKNSRKARTKLRDVARLGFSI